MGLYVAAALAALMIVNADQGDWRLAAGIVAAAALALGWGTASGWGVVVAWLLIPLALPFGDTNQFAGSDRTDPVVLLALVSAAMSAVLILAAAGARVLYNRHALRRDARQAGEAITLQSLNPPSTVESGLGDANQINPPTAAHRR